MLAGEEGMHRADLPRGSASSDVVTGRGVRSRVASKLIELVKKPILKWQVVELKRC